MRRPPTWRPATNVASLNILHIQCYLITAFMMSLVLHSNEIKVVLFCMTKSR